MNKHTPVTWGIFWAEERIRIGLVLFLGFIFAVLFIFDTVWFSQAWGQQFTYLARSFLSGHTYFLERPGTVWNDVTFANGRAYWPLGPFPAVLLMPCVLVAQWFGKIFFDGYLQLPLSLLGFGLVVVLARALKYGREDSLYIALAFLTSSFFGVAALPHSWYFAQVIAAVALFGALAEYATRRRWWLVGVCMAIALATRLTAALGIIFFVLALWYEQPPRAKAIRDSVQLLLPFALTAAALGAYNALRFGSPFESGYAQQYLWNYLDAARSYGVFSLVHVPGNLYYFFLAAPLPLFRDTTSHVLRFPYIVADPWGMSIFLTSPYFIYFFFLRTWDRLSQFLWLTIVVILLPIVMYYGVGHPQFGFRYALDAMPFVFFLFWRAYRAAHDKLSRGTKTLIVVSSLVNLYFFVSIFAYYSTHIPWTL